jgi:hypothetical protein
MPHRRARRPEELEEQAAPRAPAAPAPAGLSSAALARRAAEARVDGLPAPAALQDAGLTRALARSLLQRDNDGGTQAPSAPPATSLTDKLIAALSIYGPVNYDGLLHDIQAAPLAERRDALMNAQVRQLARGRLSAEAAVSVMSALLEGAQHWRNPPANDFFAYFVTQKATGTLPSTATMNCWEMILYSAYLTGAIGQAWIEQFYTDALAAPDPNVLIWQRLGWSAALPAYPAAQPTAGQLLFYIDGRAPYPGHVAISLGGDQAVSLWNQPHGEYATQRIHVNDLAGTVHIGTPPW